jgi:hypothetical protein
VPLGPGSFACKARMALAYAAGSAILPLPASFAAYELKPIRP